LPKLVEIRRPDSLIKRIDQDGQSPFFPTLNLSVGLSASMENKTASVAAYLPGGQNT
jgi:hypothetical protein